MRHLTSLLTLLLVGLVAYACSNSTSPDVDEFEPYRNGTFLVTSPVTADWEGAMNKAKADTVTVTDPEQQGLYLQADSTTNDPGDFDMIFVDSTLTNVTKDTTDIDWFESYFPNIESSPMVIGGTEVTWSDNHTEIILMSKFQCDADTELPTLIFKFTKKDGSPYKVYQFNIDGFTETVKDISC